MKISDIFGAGEVSSLVKSVIDLIPNKNKSDELKLEVDKLEQSGQLAIMANNLELEKLSVDNIKSAREREAQIATSEHTPYITKITTTVLAWGIIGLTFGLFWYLLASNEPIAPEKKDIIVYILGVLSAICTQIVGYYFGSTVGSAKRVDGILDMVKKK